MNSPTHASGWLQTIVLLSFAVFISGAIFLLDLNAPLGVAVGAMYCIVILYSWLLPGSLVPAYAGLLCTALVIAGLALSTDPYAVSHMAGVNRVISVVVIWVCASLVAIARRSFEELEQARYNLEQQVEERTADLKKSETRVRQMTEEISDYAIILMDTDGNIENWNLGAERIKGYSPHEVIGKSYRQFYTEEDRRLGKPEQLLGLARKEGRAQDEGWRVRKDGTTFWACVTFTAIHDEGGGIIGYSTVTRDLTERKRTEEALEQHARSLADKNRELEQYAYIASHDLRAPLRAISNLSEWLEEDLEGVLEGDTRRKMELLRSRVKRLESLIADLLKYSRAGRTNVETSKVDTSLLLNDIVAMIEPPKEFTVAIAEGMPVFETAKTPLEQVFANLIGNAIKHHDRLDGRVEINVRNAGRFYEFAVSDNGPGIAPEFHNRAFEIFQTLKPRDEVEGTGMGLAIVKRLIERYGGTITVDSVKGQGATFRFTWPQALPEKETYEQTTETSQLVAR